MRIAIALLVLGTLGCEKETAPPPVGKAITVGQAWSEAKATVSQAGYAPHDIAGLEILAANSGSPPDGFFIELSGNKALIIYHGSDHDVVKSMESVLNWHESKSARVYRPVTSFPLPPANATH